MGRNTLVLYTKRTMLRRYPEVRVGASISAWVDQVILPALEAQFLSSFTCFP